MIFSSSADYAVRAIVYLASHDGKPNQAQEIAREVDAPPAFLAKLLQDLARRGMLRSRRGPSGGFELGVDPHFITLAKVLSVMGQRPDTVAFSEKIARTINELLESTTIADLVREARRKARAAA